MKWLIVPILFLSVFAQTFSKWLIIIDYAINQKEIAETLCVNKSRPEMHCNGKCQFKKRIIHDETEQNTPLNQSLKEKSEPLQFFQSELYAIVSPETTVLIPQINLYQMPALSTTGRNCFRPPQA